VYQGAFEAVIAILVAALAGYWLDEYFETEPVLLLVGVIIGFTSFVVRLIRLGRWIHESETKDGEESTDPKR
jgi:F0F1-type ATP synthase assembly protein I